MRHDAQIQPYVVDTPPTHEDFVGLHSKAAIVDRNHVYIGSMNYDPRSALTNTAMGVFVESPELANALAKLMERDIQTTNSWKVVLDRTGKLRWINVVKVVTRQPARNWWQRILNNFLVAVLKEYY